MTKKKLVSLFIYDSLDRRNVGNNQHVVTWHLIKMLFVIEDFKLHFLQKIE